MFPSSLRTTTKLSASQILTGIFFAAMLNFTVFWVATLAIRGDGIGGKIEDGRYYVVSKGVYTEVSPAVWHYTRIHAVSVWITHPIGLAAIVLLMLTNKKVNEAKENSSYVRK